MAWQLPHEPFDENFLKNQLASDDEPKRRQDENVTDISMIDHVDRNYNSLDASSWNELLESNKVSYSSWDDSNRFVYVYYTSAIIFYPKLSGRKTFSSPNNYGSTSTRKPAKKHLVYAAIGKRSIPTTNKFDRFYMNHHRTTRHTIYKKIEKFLNA